MSFVALGLSLQIFVEKRSHQDTARRLWSIAGELGYGQWFVPEVKYQVLDDHLPFARRGIPSVLVIDMDYAYHHTTADTADKVSPLSLEREGEDSGSVSEIIED